MYMEQTPFFTDDEQAPKQMKQSGDDELTSGNRQDWTHKELFGWWFLYGPWLQVNYHNWKNRRTVTAPRHNYMSDSQQPENATNNPGSKALLNEFTQLNEGIQHVQKIVDTIKDSTQISYSG